MCGSATDMGNVTELMAGNKADMVLTDPPYNTGMTAEGQGSDTLWRGTKKSQKGSAWLSHMFDDDYTPEEFEELLTDSLASMFAVTKAEAAFYVCIDWRKVADIKAAVEKLMPVSNVIVWDKMVHGLGSDYKYTYELIVVGKKGKPDINNRIGRDYQDVWHVQRTMGRNEDHATAKPLELCVKPIKHASKQDDIVLDFFGGSGSTLIACEQTNRTCYMMELDPKYCDVIRKRYAKHIGEEEAWQEATPTVNNLQPTF
jgi:DNA modification methylase